MRDGLKFAWVLLLFLCLVALPVTAKEVTLNFKKADIRAFIEFVSGFSGKNFLVDNRVKGNVTIVSPSPISEDEAYDVFLSVLEVNGFAAVPSGSVVKIVPRAESKQKSIPVRGSGTAGQDDAVITQVLRLSYADAQQLVALFRPLISPNSHLVAYPRGNMLLLTDTASNIRRIQKILKLVDRQDAIGIQLFPLEFASAEKLAATISGLYAGKGSAAGGTGIKAIAHQPGNILVVVAAPQLLNEVAGMVKQLDIQPKPDSGRLQVRYLKHANAEDVAKVLSELVGSQNTAQPGQGKALFSGAVKVVAEPATNALLVTADPTDITAINRIIDKLDVRRLQVLIEALIVEVTGGNSEQFGIEWLSGKSFNGNRVSVVGGQNYGTISSLGKTVVDNTGNNLASAAASALGQGLTVGVLQGSLTGGTVTLGAVVRALESTDEANVLSTPNILTMDNEEAEIVVGQNVPFVTGQNSTQGGTANPFQTIERKDIGLTLRVKPQISEGETVRLEIYQETSSISAASGASDLITNKRSIKTVALAKDGQMLVLGGLMREDGTEAVSKIPCIGSVPILGEPFKSTNNTRRKVNLMVFLRPRIIRTDNDIKNITNEKYSGIKSLFEKPSAGGTIIFPHESKKLPDDMSPGSLQMDETVPDKKGEGVE